MASNLPELQLILPDTVPFYVDNDPTVKMINSISGTRLCKTIRIRHHFIQKELADARIAVLHIATHLQIAVIMTMPLAHVAFLRARELLALAAPPDTG